ncbi:FAD binding domain-containing protein [Wukongibacter baidiensis]|uniref:FAD binding domain-containing protein n=1 Tax=Wukongibacter baidiensis TaxID=1723361 RepID=UPI003D7FCA5A
MLTIQDYLLPETLEEAYRALIEKRNNKILGGCGFLRMGSQKIGTAIDLSNLNLNSIWEGEDTIEIGAMTTFRQVETSSVLKRHFDGILSKSVGHIVGVQLRNIVTVGATVYSRYGFSDFLTALLSLEAEVVLYNGGQVLLEEFFKNGSEKDILIKIIIRKTNRKAAFQMIRNSKSDYAILNVAVSKLDEDWRIVVGARPQRAKIAKEASYYLSESNEAMEEIERAAMIAVNELTFGSNMRGSEEYRRSICKVLIKRAIMEVLS